MMKVTETYYDVKKKEQTVVNRTLSAKEEKQHNDLIKLKDEEVLREQYDKEKADKDRLDFDKWKETKQL